MLKSKENEVVVVGGNEIYVINTPVGVSYSMLGFGTKAGFGKNLEIY